MIEKSQPPLDNDVTRVRSDYPNVPGLDSGQPVSVTQTPTIHEEKTTLLAGSPGEGVSVDQHLVVGSVVKGTFELVAVLGEGGMGMVFKALNKVWAEVEARDPYVAIKVLKPELSANKQLVRSLYSDFDRTKMLANCPNIIKVHGFDRDGPHVYMTMEYLSGQTLGDHLNHTPMAMPQAWPIIEGVGNALAYAHSHNIVHRDIKPGNIIITDDGVVKVLDFGIASKINEIEGDETKFGGHELGALTVAYASPEMQRDYPPDARDDIYAFACVIYEVLTGKQFYKQKIHKAAPIHGLNSRQMDILNKSLAFERDQRTTSINELLDKLRPVKTPWAKYLSIGGGLLLVLGLGIWGVNVFVAPKDNAQQIPPVAEQELANKSKEEAPVVVVSHLPAPVYEQPPIVGSEPPQPATPAASEEPPIVEPEPIQPVTPLASEEFAHSATSGDGIVHLQASKPDYKNGEFFRLSFKLAQARYVRIIDRDTNGVETVLRPNPRQPDKLLPANKEQVFPPKGFNVPVQGPSGDSTVTIVASPQPFPKAATLLNGDGSVSGLVQNGGYSWAQIHYKLNP
ncbi:MAG: serine/threonine-protein kinase [Methylococcales bacterium]|nr:serine/threonine-protein kinase [Methylococcales bacterium]